MEIRKVPESSILAPIIYLFFGILGLFLLKKGIESVRRY